MLGRKGPEKPVAPPVQESGSPVAPTTLLTIIGDYAKIDGKFEIADSIQIECEVGGELNVGGRLVIGEKGTVNANVQTLDALIMGQYEGNMVATGNVEITATGRVTGNLHTDSLVISKGGFFNGNVSKTEEKPAEQAAGEPGQRPVYRIDEKRLAQQS